VKKINNLVKMLLAKRLVLNLGQLDQDDGVPSQIVQLCESEHMASYIKLPLA
jgi:hypothetical protein